ncbi:EEF1A lysine methyltransferase 2 [Nymphon striatum]|nr:EEF1A lysine methyltransferase 2 [Nymphon striatum]
MNESDLMSGDFEASEIGKKSYWDDMYENEIKCYLESGDIGHVWFGESSVQRIVNWLCKCPELDLNSKILEVGCGNGNILLSLAEEGFKDLTGIDYSSSGIELAQKISEKENYCINYQVIDFLSPDIAKLDVPYDVLLDKGTFDAVCLSEENRLEKRQKFIEVAHNMLTVNGLFIVTTCNWTEKEIINFFSKHFNVKAVLPTPQIQFGGKSGSNVSCVIFCKRESILKENGAS